MDLNIASCKDLVVVDFTDSWLGIPEDLQLDLAQSPSRAGISTDRYLDL